MLAAVVGSGSWLNLGAGEARPGGTRCCLGAGATHLPDHGAAVVDELGQHHGHIVVDGGGVVRPLCGVAHKCAKGKDCCAAHLQVGQGAVTQRPAVWL